MLLLTRNIIFKCMHYCKFTYLTLVAKVEAIF